MTKYLPESKLANMEDINIISINNNIKEINNKQSNDPDEEPKKCQFFKDSKQKKETPDLFQDLPEKPKLPNKTENNIINKIYKEDLDEDKASLLKPLNEPSVPSQMSNPEENNPNNKTVGSIGFKRKNEQSEKTRRNIKQEMELPNLTKIDKFEKFEKRNSFSSKQRRDEETQNRRSSNCPNLNKLAKPDTSLDELYRIYNANDLYSKYVKANKKNNQILKELKNFELPEIISKEDSYSLNLKRAQKPLKEMVFERHLTSYSNEDQKSKQFIFGYKQNNPICNNNDQFISIPRSIPEEERANLKIHKDENILFDGIVISSNSKKKRGKKKLKRDFGVKEDYNNVRNSGHPRREEFNEREKERTKIDNIMSKERKNKKDVENHIINQKGKVEERVNNNSRPKSPYQETNSLISKLYPNLINSDVSSNSKCSAYKFIINMGNNSDLVKKVFMSKYPDWQVADSCTNDYQFKWEMWSKNLNFYSLSLNQIQVVNHYESNQAISTNDKLFLNLA